MHNRYNTDFMTK